MNLLLETTTLYQAGGHRARPQGGSRLLALASFDLAMLPKLSKFWLKIVNLVARCQIVDLSCGAGPIAKIDDNLSPKTIENCRPKLPKLLKIVVRWGFKVPCRGGFGGPSKLSPAARARVVFRGGVLRRLQRVGGALLGRCC